MTVALRRHDTAVAQANLGEAEDDLVDLVNAPDTFDKELLEATVYASRTALDDVLRLQGQPH